MAIKVIVGLGNTGDNFFRTRHNIGFEVVDCFREFLGADPWTLDKKLSIYFCKNDYRGRLLYLLKPVGFMNLSGSPVSRFCSFLKVPSEEIVVVCDDITLELGKVKITERVGTAGHNGVADVLAKMGPGFSRFRVGVGAKRHEQMTLADHVLSKFSEEEWSILTLKKPNICEDLKLLLDKGILSAMNEINNRKRV